MDKQREDSLGNQGLQLLVESVDQFAVLVLEHEAGELVVGAEAAAVALRGLQLLGLFALHGRVLVVVEFLDRATDLLVAGLQVNFDRLLLRAGHGARVLKLPLDFDTDHLHVRDLAQRDHYFGLLLLVLEGVLRSVNQQSRRV